MLTPREAIQAGFSAIAAGMSILEKIAAVAVVVESAGFGECVTTHQIRRQLIATGRA